MARCRQCGGEGRYRVLGRAWSACYCIAGERWRAELPPVPVGQVIDAAERIAALNMGHRPVNGGRAKKGKDGR